jgi:hypothetical protein
MFLAISIICVAVLAVVLAKRMRDGREMERHTITQEALQTLLASKQDVLVFDVRQPLDLLSDSVIIPGAQWLAPFRRARPDRLLHLPERQDQSHHPASRSRHGILTDQIPQGRPRWLESRWLPGRTVQKALSSELG